MTNSDNMTDPLLIRGGVSLTFSGGKLLTPTGIHGLDEPVCFATLHFYRIYNWST